MITNKTFSTFIGQWLSPFYFSLPSSARGISRQGCTQARGVEGSMCQGRQTLRRWVRRLRRQVSWAAAQLSQERYQRSCQAFLSLRPAPGLVVSWMALPFGLLLKLSWSTETLIFSGFRLAHQMRVYPVNSRGPESLKRWACRRLLIASSWTLAWFLLHDLTVESWHWLWPGPSDYSLKCPSILLEGETTNNSHGNLTVARGQRDKEKRKGQATACCLK